MSCSLFALITRWFRSDVGRGTVTHDVEQDVEQPVSPTTVTEDTVAVMLTKLAKLDAMEEAMASLPLPPPPAGAALLEQPATPGAPAETDRAPPEEPSLERQVAALLAIKPDLSSRKVAEILERPPSTVYRHIIRLKQREEQSA